MQKYESEGLEFVKVDDAFAEFFTYFFAMPVTIALILVEYGILPEPFMDFIVWATVIPFISCISVGLVGFCKRKGHPLRESTIAMLWWPYIKLVPIDHEKDISR